MGKLKIINYKGWQTLVSRELGVSPTFQRHIRWRTNNKLCTNVCVTGEPGIGKSIYENEQVIVADEKGVRLISIKDVKYKKGLFALGVSPDTFKVSFQSITKITRHKENRELVKITTKSGRTVRATLDHSFLILNENGELSPILGEKLKVGDFVPVIFTWSMSKVLNEIEVSDYLKPLTYRVRYDKIYPRSRMANNYYLTPKHLALNWDFGFIIGAYLAEGCYINSHQIGITSIDQEFQKALQRAVNNILGHDLKMYKKKGTEAKNMILNNSLFCQMIGNCCGVGSSKKHLPDFAYFAPQDFQRGLLDGYISGDGCVQVSNRIEFSYTSKSFLLAHGISLLLSRFGIATVLRSQRGNGKYQNNLYCRVYIRSYDIKKYQTKIGFHSSAKQSIYHEKVLPYLHGIKNPQDYFKIMPINTNKIKCWGRLNHFSIRNSLTRKIFHATLASSHKKSFTALCSALDILETTKKTYRTPYIQQLKKMLDGDVFFDEIIKIERESYAGWVYDLTVPEYGNFALANGLIVHNSYLAIDIARVFEGIYKSKPDGKLKERFTVDQIVFTHSEYMRLLLNLTMGKAIVFDEPSYAMGKRDWFKDLQKVLVQTLESQRFLVHPLFIPIINMSLLDKTVRDYLIQFQIHVVGRGHAWVYRLSPSQATDKVYRQFMCELFYRQFDSHLCKKDSCLGCKKLDDCQIFRAKYERKKRDVQFIRYEQAKDQALVKESRELTDSQLEEMLEPYITELISAKTGKLNVGKMRLLLREKEKVAISTWKSYQIKRNLEAKHPELFDDT